MKKLKLLLLKLSLIFILILSACSSLPEKDINLNPAKDEAIKFVNKAALLEKSREYKSAHYYYSLALQKYQLTDDQNGILTSSIGIARQEMYMGLMHDFSVRISALDRKLANSKPTDIKNELTFLKLEFQYNQSNYDSVLTLCKSLKDLNEENELKTLSWRILSSIKKGSSPITLISSLNSKTETAFNNFKKNKFNSSQTLSFAYYTLGYSAYNQKEYRNSIKHFQNAVKMDKYDQNFYNLATDLYYIGLCYEALLEFIPASDYFHRSYNIVNQLDNSDKKDETLFKALANEWLAYKDNKTIQEMKALKSSLNNPSLTAIIDNWLKNK